MATAARNATPPLGVEEIAQEFVSELYHENSKQRRSDAKFIERILAANFDPGFRQMMAPTHKAYPGAATIDLPASFPPSKLSFDAAVLSRRSERDFSRSPLSLRQAAKLLHHSMGVTGVLDAGEGHEQLLRAAPSGGALYPLEAYVLAQRVSGVPEGIHHFNPSFGQLELVSEGNPIPQLIKVSFVNELADAAMVIALTGVSVKNRVKYGERGYRFMLLEAGHIAQNFLLTANAMGLSAFAIGGFVDDEMDKLLKLEDFDEASLYLMAVGKPKRRRPQDAKTD